jgi:hypothetical protein
LPSSFTVTVGQGTTPQYSWNAGGAFIVYVERVSNPNVHVWEVMCSGTTTYCIPSPLTHGTVPTGTTLMSNTEPVLTPGVQYLVGVYRMSAGTGFATFTP